MTDRLGAVLLVIGALALVAARGEAETYRWVDEQGNVTYSNRPPQQRDVQTPTPEREPAPEVKAPAVKAPEVKAPEIKPPETKGAAAKALELQQPADAKMTAPANPEAKPAESKPRDTKLSVPPTPIPRTGPTKLDELLELAGVRTQLAGIVSRVAADLRPPPAQMSAADRAAIDRVLAQSLRDDAVYAAVREAFRPQVDRPSLEATAAWLRTPVARKIVALETASSEPETEQKVAEYAATLKTNPAPARRLELLQRLDWVTGANETSADLVAVIARGLSSAVSAAGPPQRRLRPGQIEDRAAQVRARANESLREVRTMSMLYTYQTLHDDELAEYVRFSGSDAGRWYNTAMRKSLVAALGKAVEQTAAELVRAVPLERWARAATPAPHAVK
ncbi:MAG TPA: DUF4124 domain-containing protein [Methylomirabilota bacterium]|nr:DUF4124 domain-containing protein [Methylomirabilota bacterium]